MRLRECVVDGCDRPTGMPGTARGYCYRHYRRWQKHGSVEVRKYEAGPAPLGERITRRVMIDSTGGCWIWQGAIRSDGYGRLGADGVVDVAHRISYRHFVGTIPDGWHIDHLCSVRACVNPMHLEAVTPAENHRRARAVKRKRAAA